MHRYCRIGKRGDIGWTQIVGLALALLLLVFLVWLAVRSGRTGVEVIGELP